MGNRLTIALIAVLASAFSTDAFAAFGRTASAFDVSSMGSAQYSIPIWVPPGIRGIQPTLALTYDSRLGYGLMGPGWTLSGLSSITRCNNTFAQDVAPAPITLTTADGLCLDGNRLRSTGTGVYQTEIANFSQVTASGTAGNGPSYFTVQGKDGLTYEYGNTTDSKILPTGSSTPYIWALDKVTDRSGNHMTFTYYQQAGAYVPLSIQYTAPSGSTSFPYQVSFAYTTKSATDTTSKYIAGAQIQQTNQLSTLTVTSSGTTVREYKLLYTTSPTTLRATLTSIQECGGSAGTDCLAATSVGYQNGTAGVANPTTASGSGATNGTVYSVDIDGDGKQDLVFATTSGSNYQWWVQLATATGYGTPISTGAVTVSAAGILLDDFYGNGKTELLASVGGIWYSYILNGTSFVATSTGTAVIANVNYSSADVDGDGLPDLVNVSKGSAGSINYGVQLNTGKGSAISFASSPVTNNLAVGAVILSVPQVFGNNQIPRSSVKHLDFDGDGRQDVAISYEYFIGFKDWYAVQPILSRGTSVPVLQGGYGSTVNGTIQPVNWNDDACTDLIFGTELLISQCNGSMPIGIALPAAPTLALDWDGDGRTDALANVGGIWQIYRSEGNTFAPGVATGIPVGTGSWVVTDKNGMACTTSCLRILRPATPSTTGYTTVPACTRISQHRLRTDTEIR